MIAKCPNNPSHKEFITSAHVVEDWKVDKHGHWLETIETTEVAHGPNYVNIWTCAECGTEAEVSDD